MSARARVSERLAPDLDDDQHWNSLSKTLRSRLERCDPSMKGSYAEQLVAVLNFVPRVFGVKTDERNWRVGAKGEVMVAKELEKLGPHWRVLHAVEVGDRGSDIDHIVIGPAGFFTLNTKRHPGSKAWVADRAVRVNRQRTDYLRNSRHESARASRMLSAAHGSTIEVQPVIVFVDLHEFDVKQQPPDVYVTTRKRLVGRLEALPIVWDSARIESVFETARLSTTWSS